MLVSAVYAFGCAMELSSRTLSSIVGWIRFQFTGAVFMGPCWLYFALQFTRKSRLRPGFVGLLFTEPLVTLVIIWSTAFSGFFFARLAVKVEGLIVLFDGTPGIWYWVYTACTSLMFGAGVALLMVYAFHSSRKARGGVLIAVAGSLVPWIANVLYIMGLTQYGIDPGPTALAITGIFFAWALFGRNFLEILPVARERVIEALRDGILIIDLRGRVIDCNPAARRLLQLGEGEAD
jgi:hypothetical protein